jgi:hypothetical protein
MIDLENNSLDERLKKQKIDSRGVIKNIKFLIWENI